jgi:pyruvate,water dikinase
MGRGIWALAQEAKRRPRVCEILLRNPPERARAELARAPEARAFLERLEGFLAQNGHRAVKEFELRSLRWEEDPSPVLGMVRNGLLLGKEGDPEVRERKTRQERAELLLALRRAVEPLPLERALGLRFRLVGWAAERVRYYLKQRENSRFYHIMVSGVLRKKVLKIEQELLAQGRLRCRDDVFFLRLPEVEALREGRLGWLDVEDRIRERRIEHIRLCKLGPPKAIGLELPVPAPQEEAAGGALLLGHSASPGRYQGSARVILDPSLDARLEPGEVLVAPYTDPAWTPLFLTAGAAVVEVGSYLSHAGTVAREFGMPCVVDVSEATKRIRTGDSVAVDGDQGRVRILESRPA